MSKYLDNDGLLYLWQKIKLLLAGKVDTVSGKGLSSNDYTTEEKNKLSGLSNYTLPTASSSTKGGVQIGNGLTMTGDVLSVTTQSASVMTGATSSADGTSGLVPAPETTDRAHVLTGEGIWDSLALHSNSGPTGKSVTLVVGMTDVSTINLGTDSSATLAATSSANGLMTAADKAKLDGFSAASSYALKTDITSMYKHKGSVSTVNDLPSSNNTEGDVYNVTATGMNYVWVVTNNVGAWDALGEVFSIVSITNSEIDTILAS